MFEKFRKSVPKTTLIHGIEVKKLPIGKYLDAIDSIKDLPEILMKNSFPGMSSDQIIQRLKKIDEQMFFEIIGSLLVTVPDQALRFIAKLIDVDYSKLRDEVSLNELKDVLKEFWAVNDMTNFFKDILGAAKGLSLTKQIMNIGSKT